MKMKFFAVFFCTAMLLSCSTNPYRKSNKIYKKQAKELGKQLEIFPFEEDPQDSIFYGNYPVGTTNFNLRKPNFVILHHTAQDSTTQTLNTFTMTRTQVSSHYVVGRDGKVYQMLNDYFRGWHAGVGQWGKVTDLNSVSLGIEIDNNGEEPFTEMQIYSLIQLLKKLKEDFKLPAANFIGHSDIAPGRKVDPSIHFPWKELAEEDFGIWYDEELVEKLEFESANDSIQTSEDNVLIPDNFNYTDALRIIGYHVDNLPAAIRAFQLHFIQKEDEITGELSKAHKKVLYALYRKLTSAEQPE